MAKVKYARQALQKLSGENYPFGEQEEAVSFAEMFDPARFDRLQPQYRRCDGLPENVFSIKGTLKNMVPKFFHLVKNDS